LIILSISDNFIRRPVLTTVCTILIVLFGSICIPLLPVEYIPQIAPIQVQVTATYTGADPETIETTVTTPIERKINGTLGMDYMTSQTIAGSSNIQVFFPVSTSQQADQVKVQNNLT
jgi:HAE1 family hydrophobic/amphiphilic exporter-1